MASALFQFEDYRQYLGEKIEEGRESRGYLTNLAQGAGCQLSHISHVLRGKAHLTLDQAAGMCEFWELTDGETDFFLELVILGRSGSKKLNRVVQRRMTRLKKRNESLSSRLHAPQPLNQDFHSLYYSSWHWVAIHMATSVPGLTHPRAIAERLNLPLSLVQESLRQLELFGLVKRDANQWKIAQVDLHLPKSSPFTQVNHMNWRQRALASIQSHDPGAIHYTAVQTMSRKDLEAMKEVLVKFISETRRYGSEGGEEEMVSFCCDLFSVGL